MDWEVSPHTRFDDLNPSLAGNANSTPVQYRTLQTCHSTRNGVPEHVAGGVEISRRCGCLIKAHPQDEGTHPGPLRVLHGIDRSVRAANTRSPLHCMSVAHDDERSAASHAGGAV